MPNIDDWGNDLLFTPPSVSPYLTRAGGARPSSEASQPPDFTLPPALDPPIIKIDEWLPLLPEFHH
jgi:hypothetical protein